jgi:tetratricopeptide (TPR) repeat protein
MLGQPREGLDRLSASYAVLREGEYDADLGMVAAQMARLLFFLGEYGRAAEVIEIALDIGEVLRRAELLCDALITKAIIVGDRGHPNEAIGLVRHALSLALESQLYPIALRATFNLVHELTFVDRLGDALAATEEGLALARRRGLRAHEWMALAAGSDIRFGLGQWDEAEATSAELPEVDELRANNIALGSSLSMVFVRSARGEFESAAHLLKSAEQLRESDDVQARTSFACAEAALLQARGDHAGALRSAQGVIEAFPNESTTVAEVIAVAGEAALARGDVDAARHIVAVIDAQPRTKKNDRINAHTDVVRAQVASASGDDETAEAAFASAEKTLAAIGTPFRLATCRLARAEWLVARDRLADAEQLLSLADDEFRRLRAQPWSERAAALRARPDSVPLQARA